MQQQLERICRQLNTLGVDTEQSGMEITILKILPYWIRKELLFLKVKDDNWFLGKLRTNLQSILNEKEIEREYSYAEHQYNIKKQINTQTTRIST